MKTKIALLTTIAMLSTAHALAASAPLEYGNAAYAFAAAKRLAPHSYSRIRTELLRVHTVSIAPGMSARNRRAALERSFEGLAAALDAATFATAGSLVGELVGESALAGVGADLNRARRAARAGRFETVTRISVDYLSRMN
jgi:hypothetical protein